MISRRNFLKCAGMLTAGAAAVAVVGLPPSGADAPTKPQAYVPDGCGYDILVSQCWADEVVARRGTEGQTFKPMEGCEFRVYSDVQRAIDEATSGQSIFVSPGTYHGNFTLRPDVQL